ncbi:MAG: 4-hydroxythreonine-4-phosphate dehydrogenase PdxA, partial [Candidatus Omnitrophica bacterium]|nr:4-hydroxythreonine-4-phosphate dehydrogenase PdxA [Candidatus Omnitrophota bacterium]
HWALSHLFGIRNPRIGVAALNPHGSEFGREEERIILPAVRASRKKYGAVSGPIPGDEIFRELREGKWDAVIAMYHDQGLAPFKMVAFDSAVNVTVGLPFIRTSPDHGTAFDIAGKCKADERPMLAAIRLACDLCLKKMNS